MTPAAVGTTANDKMMTAIRVSIYHPPSSNDSVVGGRRSIGSVHSAVRAVARNGGLPVLVKRLTGKTIAEMTYFVPSRT